ncbi:g6063, partial [Coccomyxa viridis]
SSPGAATSFPMASTYACLLIVALCVAGSANAAVTGKPITAADIPATPSAAACKTKLDAAAAAFTAGGNSISAVKQIPGADTSNYVRFWLTTCNLPKAGPLAQQYRMHLLRR